VCCSVLQTRRRSSLFSRNIFIASCLGASRLVLEIHVDTHTCIDMQIALVCADWSTSTKIYICVYAFIYVFMYMYIHTFVCMYIHAYTRMNIYISTYIHMYMFVLMLQSAQNWSCLHAMQCLGVFLQDQSKSSNVASAVPWHI